MSETRAGKYGRKNLAILVSFVINSLEPEDSYKRREYKKELMRELKKYSFEPRKKGSPRNSGSNYELLGIYCIELRNPLHLAKLIKEGIHLMYQKQTARRMFTSLVDSLTPQ